VHTAQYSSLKAETHSKRQATQHDCLHSVLGDWDKEIFRIRHQLRVKLMWKPVIREKVDSELGLRRIGVRMDPHLFEMIYQDLYTKC
jgi:hypothetical protein